MKYLKKFNESYSISKDEFPEDGHELSLREKKILKDLVGDYYANFYIKKEDGYYYTYKGIIYYNRFDGFNDLKDYIQFGYFISDNDPNNFLELLKVTKLDMSFDINWPIKWASADGHTEVVKLLLEDPRVDPSAQDNYAIIVASQFGHLEIVKLLLKHPRVYPGDSNNLAIGYASENGHIEIVKILLGDPRVDPSADRNYAIRLASENGHTEIVKLLLEDQRVDPGDYRNSAIKWASGNGHVEIVKLLLNDPRVRAKLSSEEINKYLNEIS